MSESTRGTVFILGTGLDALYGVVAPECGWVEASLPESASWPERVWAALSETYESLDPDGGGESEAPPLYDRGRVVCASPIGWGGVRLYGSILASVCPDCGGIDDVVLPDPGIPECGCGAIPLPASTAVIESDTVRIVEEMIDASGAVVLVGVPYDPVIHELVQHCMDIRFYGGLDEIEGWPSVVTDGVQPVATAIQRYR